MHTSGCRLDSARHLLLASLLLVVLLPLPWASAPRAAAQVAEDPDRWAVKLLNGTLAPVPGVDPGVLAALRTRGAAARAAGASKIHALVQLFDIPTTAQKADLAARGLDLQAYVPNNAWIAAIPAADPGSVLDIAQVRWLGDWSAADKLHPNIKAGSWGEWAVHPTEDLVMVFVQLHSDIALDTGPDLARAHGGVPLPPVSGLHGLTVWIARESLPALAAEEAVLWIEEGPAPLSPTNDGVRSSMHVDPLYSAPYNLDGSGVSAFVFDGGTVRTTHNTFNPPARVTMIDNAANVQDHPTHVAGTVAGDGDGGRAKGVAPAATILSAEYEQTGGTMLFWDNAGDIQADYALARNTYNADLGTNSIGSNTANNGYDCEREGDYGVSSNMLDGIVRGDNAAVGSPVLMTWANGNERTGGSPKGRCGSNYLTTAPPSCAKNPIHVGAINSDYDSMTTFSSWGPCDDGRLKPVISASGCELGRASGESFIYSSLSTTNSTYGGSGWCGTSMATPAVAGVVALMMQSWRARFPDPPTPRPLPALVKAMLVHTAQDLGQTGPDFIYGYGEVNAQRAVDLIRQGAGLGGAGPTNFGADQVGQGEIDNWTVTVPAGTAVFKATLAWDDYAAAAYSASAPVNNLNLEVVAPGGTIHYPWTLSSAAPYAPAATGVNNLDNQEQVIISNPAAGTWTVRVRGTAVPQAPQTYGLVYTSAAATYDAANCLEQVSDGGFELGTGWTLSGATRTTGQRHSGSYALSLGGANNASHTAYQQITIPAGVARAEMSFWWYMTTQEGSSGHTWDYFYAELRSTAGTVLATFDYRSDGWQQGQWMKAENMDLTPWAGQTVRLYFYATNDTTLPTTFWVDDVSLSTCPPPSSFTVAATPAALDVCKPNSAVYNVVVAFGATADDVTLSVTGLPAGATPSWSVNPVTPSSPNSVLTVTGLAGVTAGAYALTIIGTSTAGTHQDGVQLNLYDGAPTAVTGPTPADGATAVGLTSVLGWSDTQYETGYTLQVDTDPAFTPPLLADEVLPANVTSYSGLSFALDTVYYWRVRATNTCGSHDSPVWTFRTAGPQVCTELLLEPGFEGGAHSAWSESSVKNPAIVNAGRARNGTYAAWLGAANRELGQVWQSVTVPSGAATVTLNYWYDIDSVENRCVGTDLAEVRINGTAVRSHQLCETSATTGYVQGAPVSLSADPGSMEIRFWASTNQSEISTFYVDDVSIQQCTNGPSTSADYSDLPGSYGIAWHTGTGALRLGTGWDADTTFAAADDDASDDGVSFPDGLQPGTGRRVWVTVQGASAARWLRIWFDWNGDGVFGDQADGERVYNGTVNNGLNQLAITVPSGYSGQANYRVRLYDSAGAPLAQDSGSYGGATGGEVEDGSRREPTAVDLVRFEAWPAANAVRVEWETATEIDNLGFNLYRSDTAAGTYVQVNDALIPSRAPGAPVGAVYTWLDAGLTPGRAYYYQLEDVDVYGVATRHGPVWAVPVYGFYLPLLTR